MHSQRTCSIDGCERTMRARTWCDAHYKKWRKYGTPHVQKQLQGVPTDARFWAFVNVGTDDECWEWTGSVGADGYVRFRHHYQTTYGHRYSYKALRGPIPTGLVLDHLCRNPKCVNPWHLEAVTNEENIRRGMPFRSGTKVNGRVRKSHCPLGHPYDETNTIIRRDGTQRCRECNSYRWPRKTPQKRGKPHVK